MAEHHITAEFQREIPIDNKDLKIVVRRRKKVFGTLTLSKGTIDWRPTKKHRGGENEIKLTWEKFDQVMRES
jgi:hypothetical protein